MKHLAWLLLFSTSVFALGDLEREKRLSTEVEDSIIDGDPIWLTQGDHKFLGIYTEAETTPKGDLLILHGRGYHPNWPDFVYPVRTKLAEQGWNTLTIQLPVLAKQATYNDYVPLFPEAADRIQIALDYLKNKSPNAKKILIAHSCGFHMANHWLREQTSTPDLAGFIGLGMGPTDARQLMAEPFFLHKLKKTPILDIYAEYDYNKAIRFIKLRKFQARHPKSKQVEIKGAKHYYKEKGDIVAQTISQWLETL